MDPIFEIISKNIYLNNKYSHKLKNEFIMTINQIIAFEPIIEQYIRSMNFVMAYNALYDKIIFLNHQREYFKIHFATDVMQIVEDYINMKIDIYNHQMLTLLN